jgi:peptide subunit release factor 1 (eRF1)
MELMDCVPKLSKGAAVGGMRDTARALNESRVRCLILSANLESTAGWQCLDCSALHAEMDAQPETCSYCGSTQIQAVDLKAAMIARSYQVGSSIEIVSRSSELEHVRGIGAVLHNR